MPVSHAGCDRFTSSAEAGRETMSAFLDMLVLLAVMAVLVAQTFFPPR
jgi:hypothetical protein